MNEFDIIKRFFSKKVANPSVVLGIGDDAAVLTTGSAATVVSVDTLNAGVHFFSDAMPADIGYKALAVSLSDMAAMGARPHSVLLALSMPSADHQWLSEFSQGFFELASKYNVSLIGGDTTRGALSVTVTMIGTVPEEALVLKRSSAQVGDHVYVSGTLGDAAFALAQIKQQQTVSPSIQARLLRPSPRVECGQMLRTIASSAIDISDGLLQDAGHICQQSAVGIEIALDRIPLSATLCQLSSRQFAVDCALRGGDDYELLFTVPPQAVATLVNLPVAITAIGYVVQGGGVSLIGDHDGYHSGAPGYQHFR